MLPIKHNCSICGKDATWKLFTTPEGRGDDPTGVAGFSYACDSHVEDVEDRIRRSLKEGEKARRFPVME